MPKDVNLGMVSRGCKKIDKAIEMYQDVESKISNASSLLSSNRLKFGDIGSSLEEQLDILRSQVEKCESINDGVTATIMANAQAQHQEYIAWVESQKKKNDYKRV